MFAGIPIAHCRRQLLGSVPLLPSEVDPVRAIDPHLRREVVTREHVVKPIWSVLAQPRLLVLVSNQRVSVAQILKSAIAAGDVREIAAR